MKNLSTTVFPQDETRMTVPVGFSGRVYFDLREIADKDQKNADQRVSDPTAIQSGGIQDRSALYDPGKIRPLLFTQQNARGDLRKEKKKMSDLIWFA